MREFTLRRAITIPRLLVLSFAGVILLGAWALWALPTTREGADPLRFVDALFTSTSAVCVTGLTTRDTELHFNLLGQFLILVLIQLGGLGILTLSNMYLLIRGQGLGMAGRVIVEETQGIVPTVPPAQLVRDVFRYTLGIEAVGAVLLAVRFAFDMPLHKALWHGIFHSVSAFCNAGFSLFSANMVPYRNDVFVNSVIMLLIIFGGLGFVVYSEISAWLPVRLRGLRRKLTLQSRVVGLMTLLLVFGGGLLLWLLELHSVPAGGNAAERFLSMLFLSVSSRTAGFNTVDLAQLQNTTILIVMVLMFIGASPGSTGGGIKTTTFATLIGLFLSRVRNRPHVELLDRSVSTETVAKALAVTAGFFISVVIAVVMLESFEQAYGTAADLRAAFLPHLFEVISALGTVGLSMGVTAGLSDPSKLVIIFCMFLGRLGPLVMGASVVGDQRSLEYRLPEEGITIG